jgi:hypothetical protein
MILEAHPQIGELTDAGRLAWAKAAASLSRKHGLADVDGAVRWVFGSNGRDATFWRKQVQSLSALARSKGSGEPTKIQQILGAWAGATKQHGAAARFGRPTFATPGGKNGKSGDGWDEIIEKGPGGEGVPR